MWDKVKNRCLRKHAEITFLIIFYFIIQLKFLNDVWFGTDELDIMLNGRGISRGLLLYKDLISQHMPFSYYISAFFCSIGLDTVIMQRLAFYLFFAIFWGLIVLWYSDVFEKRILMLYPLVHCCVIQNYDMGTQILSEHIAALGAVILLLEFLSFVRNKEIGVINCCRISLAVIFMFGTIFVAIYPIFFIFIGVLALEIRWKLINDKVKIWKWLIYIIKKYICLVCIVAIPWIILGIYYVWLGTMDDFVQGAYTINRIYYPKYNGGFGDNIFVSFLYPVQIPFQFLVGVFNAENIDYKIVLQLILFMCTIFAMVFISRKEGKIVGTILFLYVFSLGIRGLFNFHSTHCTAVMSLATVYFLFNLYEDGKDKSKLCSKKLLGIVGGIAFVISSGYLFNVTEIASISFKQEYNYNAVVLNAITEENEPIWMTVFGQADIMIADRIAYLADVTSPWTWENSGQITMERMNKEVPRVVYYYDNYEIWGYKQSEYAAEVVQFIHENYSVIPNTSAIYVRNDYYMEACDKVNQINMEEWE